MAWVAVNPNPHYSPERLPRAGAMETSTSLEIDTTKVSVPKHFGHSKVRKSKPDLSGSMIRNAIISPHFEHRGFLIRSTNTAYPSTGKCTLRRALRESYVLKVTVVWKSDGRLRNITNESNMKFAQCLPHAGTQSPAKEFGFIPTNSGVF
jgi:hypothetical protein